MFRQPSDPLRAQSAPHEDETGAGVQCDAHIDTRSGIWAIWAGSLGT